MLTLIGLDEAGFGPLLGPLCTGAASISLDFDPAEGPPDLWSQLAPVVGTSPRACDIPVADSKKLKSSSKLPLRNLLAGLVPFVELASSTELQTDEDLLRAIGVEDLVPIPSIWINSMGLTRGSGRFAARSLDASRAKEAFKLKWFEQKQPTPKV